MTQEDTLHRLLREHPRTFAQQAGVRLTDSPAPLFRLLVLTSLLSANLDARLGLRTAHALYAAGFTTAQHLADASDEQRWQVLSDSKYLRKKQTARQLGALAERAVDVYGGDLRTLRDEADGDVERISDALQEFTGIGAVGAGIFCREVQAVWPTVRPFADAHLLDLAGAAKLPRSAKGLAALAGTEDLSHVGAALVFDDMTARAERK